MSVQNVTAVPPANPARTKLERFQHALRNVEPSKSKKRDDAVVEAYDTIREHHERKVPWKTITAMFNEAYGLKMHPEGCARPLTRRGHVAGPSTASPSLISPAGPARIFRISAARKASHEHLGIDALLGVPVGGLARPGARCGL